MSSLGLLYTTLANRADRIMVPNTVVLSAAVVPLREPDGVDLRARLAGQLIYRVRATPADSEDGPELADEVVAALDRVSNGRHDG